MILDGAAGADQEIRKGRLRPGLIGLGCGLAVLLWLIIGNRQNLSSVILDDGDFAANAILIDRAEQFRLAVGNYSRFGFNHPGPALLYVQGLGELIYYRLLGVVQSPYTGHWLGIMTLNAVCVGTACSVVCRWTGRWVSAAGLVAIIPVLHIWQPYSLASTWMPNVYIAVFLLMSVSCASVASGRWAHLWLMVVAVSLCVHGHVSFVLFGIVSAGLATASCWLWNRRNGSPPRRSDLLWAGLALAAFIAPIVVHTLRNWPGELQKYWDVSTAQAGFVERTAGEVVLFAGRFWTMSGTWMILLYALAVALVVVSFLANRRADGARFRIVLLCVCGVETLMLVVYAARGVDDLQYDYVAWFILSCPLLVLWSGLDSLLEVLAQRAPGQLGRVLPPAICAGLAALLILVGTTANPYPGMSPNLAQALGSDPVRLSFTGAGWQPGLGLLEDARRRGQSVCVVDEIWVVSVTPAEICTPGDQGELIKVVGRDEPRTGVIIYDDGYYALVRE